MSRENFAFLQLFPFVGDFSLDMSPAHSGVLVVCSAGAGGAPAERAIRNLRCGLDLVGGSRGYGAGGGAYCEPFGGAGNPVEQASAFGGADGFISLLGQSCGFDFLVGQVGLGGGELGLAGFAVDGEVVEWLEVGGWDYGLGLLGFGLGRVGVA